MDKYLLSKAKKGEISYLETRLDWGRKHKEFLIYSHTTRKLSRIFYDNKYREDQINFQDAIKYYNSELEKSKEGLNDKGIYNTKKDFDYYTNILDFLNDKFTRINYL